MVTSVFEAKRVTSVFFYMLVLNESEKMKNTFKNLKMHFIHLLSQSDAGLQLLHPQISFCVSLPYML